MRVYISTDKLIRDERDKLFTQGVVKDHKS